MPADDAPYPTSFAFPSRFERDEPGGALSRFSVFSQETDHFDGETTDSFSRQTFCRLEACLPAIP